MSPRLLIIGQGLCGTWLSWFCVQHKIPFTVVDQYKANSSSRIASGVINPVTGRNLVKTWLADEMIPFVEEQYNLIASFLGIDCLRKVSIQNFLPNEQMRLAYEKKEGIDPQFLGPWQSGEKWKNEFHFEHGIGDIRPAYLLRLNSLLHHWKQWLLQNDLYRDERIDWRELQFTKHQYIYQATTYSHVVCCDGIEGSLHPQFQILPFIANKGEALLMRIPQLPSNVIYKRGMSIVPWDEPGLFWVGSTYEHQFAESGPTHSFYTQTIAHLQQWLKLPYEVVDHWAAIRPATVDRRPFVGWHPLHPGLGILNGMGTKGCGLAPWFAKELINNIVHQSAIHPEANIDRFKKLLTKNGDNSSAIN